MVETLSAGPSGATVEITGLPEPPAVTRRKAGGCKVPSLSKKRLKAARKSIRKRDCKVGKVNRREKVNVVVSSGPAKGR